MLVSDGFYLIMPFQSVTSDVREEAGNVLTIDFPDLDIQKEQAAAYGFLRNRVGEYDATNDDIDALRKLEQILAAYFVLRHFPNRKQEADDILNLFKTLFEEFGGVLGGEPDIDFTYAFTSYGSWPAAFQENQDTETRPYKSTNVFVPP